MQACIYGPVGVRACRVSQTARGTLLLHAQLSVRVCVCVCVCVTGAPHKEAARKVLDMDSLSDNTADTYAYAKTQNKKQPWWQTLLGGCGAARFGLEDEE